MSLINIKNEFFKFEDCLERIRNNKCASFFISLVVLIFCIVVKNNDYISQYVYISQYHNYILIIEIICVLIMIISIYYGIYDKIIDKKFLNTLRNILNNLDFESYAWIYHSYLKYKTGHYRYCKVPCEVGVNLNKVYIFQIPDQSYAPFANKPIQVELCSWVIEQIEKDRKLQEKCKKAYNENYDKIKEIVE